MLAIVATYWMTPRATPEDRVDDIVTTQGMLKLAEITKEEGQAA